MNLYVIKFNYDLEFVITSFGYYLDFLEYVKINFHIPFFVHVFHLFYKGE